MMRTIEIFMGLLALLMIAGITQASEIEINISNSGNSSGADVKIDKQAIQAKSPSAETDALAEEMAWEKSGRKIYQNESLIQERALFEAGGWAEWYINPMGDEVRITYAPNFGMMYFDHQFGINGKQNETRAELENRINDNLTKIAGLNVPIRYSIESWYDDEFGLAAVMNARYLIPCGELKEIHRTYESVSYRDSSIRNCFGIWFRNV